MENKKNENFGLCKASIVLGVVAIVFSLTPLVSVWLMFLSSLNYLLVPAGIICGVIALVKGQDNIKSIIGIVLNVVAITLPFILAEYYLSSAADSVGNMLDAFGGF
jgi:hypothetical protein